MKPYYQDKWVTIYHGDCRELLQQLDVKVDLVLTDPPYGVGLVYESYEDTPDNWRTLMQCVIPQLRAMAECVIMPCSRIIELPFIYANFPPDWLICWYKGSPGMRAWVGFNDWEPLLVYGKIKGTQYHDYFYAQPSDNGKYAHPCPKPNGWADYLISKASMVNNVVLDPFLGSGTTCYSAKKLLRRSIGIELDERYCEIAARRCSQQVMELD